MAKTAKVAWGIDLGNSTLKAVKLGVSGSEVELLDFAVIEHETILSQPDVTPEQRGDLIRAALARFVNEHDVEKTPLVVGVPGQNSFARFIKLPPVEKKRIPEIVRFEAIQQIPFDIEEVEWDWQTFEHEDNPEVEVGIFAIKRDTVNRALAPFVEADLPVSTVQMGPMALYNFLRHDQALLQKSSGNEAIVAIDVGADNTDLVIADGKRVWQRTIPIGGNNFTAAVQKAFKLGFAKAEAIKRTANTSKYARQIFQAMRNVFADLAGEIQRSLGFYSSSRRDVQFRQVLAMGNAMKLPGLMKFLQQSLSLPVKRLDSFDNLRISAEVSVAQFTENLAAFGTAYGLALQEVGFGAIESNLLPREIARQSMWRHKKRWFLAAAAVVMVAAMVNLFHGYSVRADIEEAQESVREIERVEREIQDKSRQAQDLARAIQGAQQIINQYVRPYEQRDMTPLVLHTLRRPLPHEDNVSDAAQRAMLAAYATGDREGVLAAVPERRDRKQIFLTRIDVVYTEDIAQDFEAVVTGWHNRQRTLRREQEMAPDAMMDWGMPGMMPGMGPGMGPGGGPPGMMPGGPGAGRPRSGRSTPTPRADRKGGFVVVIEGYTPHRDNLQFLRPPEAGIDRSRWGYFDYLEYLGMSDEEILERRSQLRAAARGEAGGADQLTAAQAALWRVPDNAEQAAKSAAAAELPFRTYIDPEARDPLLYFDATQGDWVGLGGSDEPAGLGLVQATGERIMDAGGGGRQQAAVIRVDPLTYEPMSATFQRDDRGEIVYRAGRPVIEQNDFWFRVRFKMILKEDAGS